MAKTASEIVDRALTLIDEVPTTFNNAATTETSIREQALEILPEVCRDLIKELPWSLKEYLAISTAPALEVLDGGEVQTEYYKRKVAFALPDDFWEFVSVKLNVWSKVVTNYIYIGSSEYSKQNNPFTRSGKHNPSVAISKLGKVSGNQYYRMECFSVEENDSTDIQEFRYISFDNVPNEKGTTTWPDELFDEVTKALATELKLIKSDIEGAVIKSQEVDNALSQHE